MLDKSTHTQLVDTYLKKVKWRGDEATTCCPFHNDENPSFSVNIEKETFFCHGCDEKGHISQLYMQLGAEYPRETVEEESYDYYDAQGEFVVTVEKKVQYNGEKKFFRKPKGVKIFIQVTSVHPVRISEIKEKDAVEQGYLPDDNKTALDKLLTKWRLMHPSVHVPDPWVWVIKFQRVHFHRG